jgi:hypothetical protein
VRERGTSRTSFVLQRKLEATTIVILSFGAGIGSPTGPFNYKHIMLCQYKHIALHKYKHILLRSP